MIDVSGVPPSGRVAGAGGPREAGRVRRLGVLGPAGAGASGTRRPASPSSASLRPPTAPTGPAGCSPATGRATSSSPPCTAPASPTSPRRPTRTTGCELTGVWITAPVRCAPPANKPTPEERDTCRPWLDRELALLPQLRVFIVLGSFGYEAMARYLGVRPRPTFGHGVEVDAGDGRTILCSYHVSQQNTFTGKLTEPDARRRLRTGEGADGKTGLMAHVEGLVGDRSLSGSACTAARCGLNGESSSPGGDSATSPCRTGRRGDRDHSAASRSPPGGRPLDSSTSVL